MLALQPPHRPDVHTPTRVYGRANSATALNVAAYKGHTSIVRLLLAERPPPAADFVDAQSGYSALGAASLEGHAVIVELLLSSARPPSLAVANHLGRTPLVDAATACHARIVAAILRALPPGRASIAQLDIALAAARASAAVRSNAECDACTVALATAAAHAAARGDASSTKAEL